MSATRRGSTFMPLLVFASMCAQLAAPLATARAQDVPSSPMDRVIERLELSAIPLADALHLISDESGVNLAPSAEAATRLVTVFLQNVTVEQAIETIAKSNGLWFRVDPEGGIVRVMSSEEYERDLVLFRDEETRVFTLLYPNATDVALAVRNLFGERVRLSMDEHSRFDDYDEINQRFQRFDLLEQRAQSFGIFSGGGQSVVSGGGSVTSLGGGNAYSRQNTSSFNSNLAQYGNGNESQREAESLPRKLDADLTPEQIAALEKTMAQSGAAGIDPSVLAKLRGGQTTIHVTIVRRNNMVAVRSSDRDAICEIERIVRQLDVPTPQVLLEMKVLSVDLGEEFHSVFDTQYDGGSSDVSFSTGALDSGDLGGGLTDPTALIYRYVNGSFRARLQLLETRGRVTTLATPLLLVANNEVARLFVGEERPIVRNVSSQTSVTEGVAATSASPTIELRPVGTTLLLTPNINADKTVTMRLIQETSTVKLGDAAIPVQVSDGGSLVAFPVDVVASRNVNATVIAKDGTTLALGGLVEEGIDKRRSGIPWLMDVPYLGALFRRDDDIRRRSELIVLIRPTVVFTATEGQARSQELLDHLSHHPSAPALGATNLDAFSAHEVARPKPDADALREALEFQSGDDP
jgi:general secretion pathway protein D